MIRPAKAAGVCVIALIAWLALLGRAAADPGLGTADFNSVDVRGDFAAVVGQGGAVYFIELKRWKVHRQQAPSSVGISAVDIDGNGHVWTAGLGGQYLHWNKKSWTAPAGSTSRNYFGIAMLGRGRGITVGRGRIFYRNARRWTRFSGGPNGTWRDVSAMGPSSAIAVGDGGKAIRIQHRATSLRVVSETTRIRGDLTAVAACRGGEAVAVGALGVVSRRARSGRWTPLPSAPGTLRSVAVQCRGRRIVGVVVAGVDTLYQYHAKKKSWIAQRVPHATSINDMAWAGRARLLVVGAKGFARLVTIP